MKKSRLRRIAEGDPSIPMGILFKDFDTKIIDKDKFTKETYDSSISHEWEFEKPIDNMEWRLQSNFAKKLL